MKAIPITVSFFWGGGGADRRQKLWLVLQRFDREVALN